MPNCPVNFLSEEKILQFSCELSVKGEIFPIFLWTFCEKRKMPIFLVNLLWEETNPRFPCEVAVRREKYRIVLWICLAKRKIPRSPVDLLGREKGAKMFCELAVTEEICPTFLWACFEIRNIWFLLWSFCERRKLPNSPETLLWEEQNARLSCELAVSREKLLNVLWVAVRWEKCPTFQQTCC